MIVRSLAAAVCGQSQPWPRIGDAIIRRCTAYAPALRESRVLEYRVGLRPVRPEVCLVEEDASPGRLLHNYGHGGAGFTLSWGCAAEITAMVLGKSK
ncbi:FAD-dependent oxidoreductase [Yinghuangia sp. YIM S10712]|uniref:FAD-dependent oxidoreductase n=1 Tax=Yinghuangia sp. YIM S10712 TaxID=3436930 RepID=UPI003F538EA2